MSSGVVDGGSPQNEDFGLLWGARKEGWRWSHPQNRQAARALCSCPSCAHGGRCRAIATLSPEPGCNLRPFQTLFQGGSTSWAEPTCTTICSPRVQCLLLIVRSPPCLETLGKGEGSGPNEGGLSPSLPSYFCIFFCIPSAVILSLPLAKASSSMYLIAV